MTEPSTMLDLYATLRKSKKFLSWDKAPLRVEDVEQSHIGADERHFTPSEISKMWGVSVDLIRDIFRKEQGVLALDRTGRGKYITMRVPESVLTRVHRRLSQG